MTFPGPRVPFLQQQKDEMKPEIGELCSRAGESVWLLGSGPLPPASVRTRLLPLNSGPNI